MTAKGNEGKYLFCVEESYLKMSFLISAALWIQSFNINSWELS